MSEVSQGEISSIASSGGEEGSTPNAGPTSSASGEDSYVNSGCKQDAEATYNKFIALKYSYTYQEDTARNGYILHDLHNDDLPIEVITTDSSEMVQIHFLRMNTAIRSRSPKMPFQRQILP